MSPASVEAAERMFAEINRGGQAAISPAFVERYFDADVVWEGIDDAPDRGPFHGRDEVLAHLRSWFGTLDAFRSEPEEIIDAGERIVILHRSHGILRGSNAEVDLRFASVSEVRDGRIVSHKQYRRPADAFKAAGLER
jgi:ketosteroid isomerase-like protein